MTDKALNLTYKSSIALFGLFTLLNLIGSNFLSTHGHEIERLTAQSYSLAKENLLLETQISENSSYLHLKDQATKLGFLPISKITAIDSAKPVAYVAQ